MRLPPCLKTGQFPVLHSSLKRAGLTYLYWKTQEDPWTKCVLEGTICCSKICAFFLHYCCLHRGVNELCQHWQHPILSQSLALGLVAENNLDDPFFEAHGLILPNNLRKTDLPALQPHFHCMMFVQRGLYCLWTQLTQGFCLVLCIFQRHLWIYLCILWTKPF